MRHANTERHGVLDVVRARNPPKACARQLEQHNAIAGADVDYLCSTEIGSLVHEPRAKVRNALHACPTLALLRKPALSTIPKVTQILQLPGVHLLPVRAAPHHTLLRILCPT